MIKNIGDTSWIDELIRDSQTKKDPEKMTDPEPEELMVKDETDDVIYTDTEEAQRNAEEVFWQQQVYEAEMGGYEENSPYSMFPHDFKRAGYLPVKVVRKEEDVYVPCDLKDLAQMMVEGAYTQVKKGMILNHGLFCEIWFKKKRYVYAGYILTPEGKIDSDTFKSEIVKVLLLMRTEAQNMDLIATRLYNTYISGYKMDAYNITNLIPFSNGDLELDADGKGYTFYDGRKTSVPYRFSYEFKNIPNCGEPDFPNFRRWRNDLFDREDFFSLKQMLGYLLLPDNEAQEAFFIIGKAGSGKSILTNTIIPKMLGDACFPMSIGQFFNDKFQMASCEGKLCMVDDDIGEAKFTQEDSGRFKNFVTAERIKIEHKYCNPTSIVNSARIVCAGNHMIKSDDKTDGFTRRLHPLYVKPRESEEVDRKLPKKIEEELPLIVLWALEGLLELKKNDGVPYRSYKTAENFDDYSEGQKWEEQFVRDTFEYKEDSITYSPDVRELLSEWLKENSDVTEMGSIEQKFRQVSKWIREEGKDKYGYSYRRGIKRGDKYNARGFINMAVKPKGKKPMLYMDERGHMILAINRKKDGSENGQ